MITPELRHIRIVAANQDKYRLIRRMHELGCLHITETDVDNHAFTEDTSLPEADKISNLLLSIQYIERQTGAEETAGIDQLPRLDRTVDETESFLDTYLDEVERLAEQIQEHKDKQERCREQIRIIESLPEDLRALDDPIIFTSPRSLEDVSLSSVKHQGKHYYAVTSSGISRAQETKALLDHGAQRIDLSYVDSTPVQAKDHLQTKIQRLDQDIHGAEAELDDLRRSMQPKLGYLHSCLKAHYDELTLPNKFQSTDDLTIIDAYCEPSDLAQVRAELDDATIYQEEADDGPTKLKDDGYNEAFQQITSLFDTPAYGAFDPTGLVTMFYPLFFGFMLSDIGYGLLVFASIFLLRHWFEDIEEYTQILSVSAISTIAFGILFGSFFGELIPVEPLWAPQFDASLEILILALGIGLLHMNIGVVIDVYQRLKQGDTVLKTAQHTVPLPLTEASAVALYFGWTWPGITGLCIATAVLITTEGFIGIFGLSDYLGTWFSYARLLALSLATAGIALAVNLIATMTTSLPVIGVVLYPLTLIIGHTFNYAVNVLGSTINAARLHYVEFFDLFFQGGGHQFTPFKLP